MRSCQVQVTRRYDIREQNLIFGVPERGIDNLRQANMVRRLRALPRMIVAGPSGCIGPWQHSIQGGHPSRWEHAFGGPSSSAQPVTEIVLTGAIAPIAGGAVEIIMILAGACHNAIGEGTVDWELVLTVSDGTNTETLTGTYPITTIGTQGAWHVTQGSGAVTGWLSSLQRAVADPLAAEYYPCREGQMLRDDFGKTTAVIMRVPTPSGAFLGGSVTVTAECVGNVEDLAVGADPFEFQHLTCVAWSVHLFPDEEP
jgi:hypothetical protein